MQNEMELGLRMRMLETFSNLGRSMAWQGPWGFVGAEDSEVSQSVGAIVEVAGTE